MASAAVMHPAPVAASSAAGVLALLEEEDDEAKADPYMSSSSELNAPSSSISSSSSRSPVSVGASSEAMFSSSAMPGAEQALLACESCGINLPEALKSLRENFFMIAVQDFQDPYTLNVRQLMK